MWPIAVDGVAWSVSRSVCLFDREHCKTAEPIETPFWIRTRVGPRNHTLDSVQIPTREGTTFRAKKGADPKHGRACPMSDILKASHQIWQRRCGTDADWGVLNWVHIGATWRIRLNRPCAAAMRSCQINLTICQDGDGTDNKKHLLTKRLVSAATLTVVANSRPSRRASSINQSIIYLLKQQ